MGYISAHIAQSELSAGGTGGRHSTLKRHQIQAIGTCAFSENRGIADQDPNPYRRYFSQGSAEPHTCSRITNCFVQEILQVAQ